MHFSTAVLATIAALASAQQTYVINPNNVELSLRQYWCQEEKTQCPLICLQTSARSSETEHNDCDANLLTYQCVCSNGLSPNLTQYSQTLPFFICQEWGNECVHNCGSDSSCASACRQDHPCGAQSPYTGNKSAITTTSGMSAGASKTGGSGGQQTVYNGFAGSGNNGKGGNGNGGGDGNGAGSLRVPFMVENGRWMGSVVVLGGLFAGFAMVL